MGDKLFDKQPNKTNYMEQRPSWEADSHSASQDIPEFYGGQLPCSQGPTTGPYSEPDASSPHLPTLFP